MKRKYDPKMLADRYKVPISTVVHWIERGYLDATITNSGYTIKEKALVDFEGIPPYRYEPVKEKYYSADIGEYTSYGIRVSEIPSGREVKYFSDVSTDIKRIEKLCALATGGLLSPMHLLDVIEDYIYS